MLVSGFRAPASRGKTASSRVRLYSWLDCGLGQSWMFTSRPKEQETMLLPGRDANQIHAHGAVVRLR